MKNTLMCLLASLLLVFCLTACGGGQTTGGNVDDGQTGSAAGENGSVTGGSTAGGGSVNSGSTSGSGSVTGGNGSASGGSAAGNGSVNGGSAGEDLMDGARTALDDAGDAIDSAF